MSGYYYTYLGKLPDGKLRQKVYYQLRQGIESLAPSFPVQRVDGETLSDLFTFVRLDHPEIFYAPGFSYQFYPQADTIEFIPKYLFKKKDIQEHQRAVDARVQKLARPAAELDPMGKEQYIHDFICENVRYDKLKKEYSHEIIGPLTQGVGVCEGIAKTVKILCDTLHIPCTVVLCGNNPEKGIRYRHAWNVVELGGKHYHLDATFDNTLTAGGAVRYDYFNIDDTSVFRDHEPLLWSAPACSDRTKSYYAQKKLALTKTEDVRSRASQAAKKNRDLTFQWRGGYLTRSVLDELCSVIGEEAEKKEKEAVLSLNWPQAVLNVRFEAKKDTAPHEMKIIMEISNEGEAE